MLMDLSCPVEFVRVEPLRDSSGRAQAYLTFMNLSDQVLFQLRAMVTMLDKEGVSLGIQPLKYDNLDAAPRAQFTLCMVMDDLPYFEGARVTISQVGFEGGETWVCDQNALRDCTPKALAPGPARVALVAVAGKDAVCFPEERQDTWVCVCGRFNELSAPACRRCLREREGVFSRYEIKQVMQAYQLMREEEIAFEHAAREQMQAANQHTMQKRQRDFSQRLAGLKKERGRRTLAVVGLLLVLLAGLLLTRLAKNNSRPSQGTQVLLAPDNKAPEGNGAGELTSSTPSGGV